MNDIFHKLLIFRTPGIGPVKYAELVNKFGSPAAAADSLNCTVEYIDSVKREMDAAAKLGIRYICEDSEYYPDKLKSFKNRPPVVSVRGDLETLKKPSVSIVGTRHATGAGMKFVSDLAREFASNGYAVVSGMAMGTDTAAHTGALSAGADSCTIAVLAGGADYIWPLENEKLYHRISERGLIVSRMPVGYVPDRANFVQRNRGIAGLGDKLILGEADEKSGSMSTAGFAMEFERPVFAIPGHPSDSRSAGPNRLIKENKARMCTGPSDFFEIKELKSEKSESNTELLDRIGIIPIQESVLAELVKKSTAETRRELVMLELCGRVRKTDGGYVKA
ncbi:MAG: DNA-processing protein DprA [Alphaproteobacteria bacterium]|nr:DNA-processing protein DprA [Alphaproteobacteria bacterium]